MFYKETEFQDSPIGKIPKDWNVQELGDESIADIIAGQSPPSSTYNKENHGLPFLQGKMEFGEMFPSPTTYCSEPIKISKKNDVLLSVRAPVGDVNIAPSECCIGRGLAAIRAKADKLNHLFLFYYLKLGGKRFEALSTGSTFKAIRIREIEKFSIPVPSVEEQRGIVGVLGVVDSVIAKTGEVIAKTERLKKGLMQTLLTRGIGHKEYKQTPIGTIPKEWEIIRLKDKAWVKEGVYGKRGEKGVIQLKADSISDSGRINANAYALISVDRQIDDYLLEPGDIILSNRNSAALVGKCAIFRGEFKQCVFSNLLTRIRLNSKDVLPEWLLYILMKIKDDGLLRAFSTRAVNQVLLKKELVENLKVPLPSISEQQEIVNILSAIDDKLELEKEEKAKLERIKQGLMDLLLTGKIRVKVD